VDVVIIAELKELLAGELSAIVSDDGVWDSEAMNDIGEKEHRLLGFDTHDRSGLDPFQEFVDGDKQVGAAPRCFLEGPDKVETLDREGPCDGDFLECLGQQMGLSSVVLASLAKAHHLGGIGQ
jgi:hypothetical protein